MKKIGTAFTQSDLNRACDDMATLPFFPRESRASIMIELAAMCPHLEALEWLALQVRTKLKQWQGLAELRGILCWKYDAADGHDAYSSISGFTPEDGEQRTFEHHRQLTTANGWDAEALQDLRQLPASNPNSSKGIS